MRMSYFIFKYAILVNFLFVYCFTKNKKTRLNRLQLKCYKKMVLIQYLLPKSEK